ncbi:MAG: hypothetical protein IT199_02305 [Solirubrobacterales bacterium]|nr:hypothetical protein [Solirubrobacterales bacterium]
MKTVTAIAILLSSLVAVTPALALDPPTTDPSITDGTAAREFNQARAKWRQAGIAGYRMKVVRSCFCLDPYMATVTVRPGGKVDVSDPQWTGPRTMPQMFRVIGQAIRKKVAVLDTTYGGQLGIPRRTYIDYIAMAVDDEIEYRISGFRPLPVPANR